MSLEQVELLHLFLIVVFVVAGVLFWYLVTGVIEDIILPQLFGDPG